jgi:YfiH family protein
MVHTAGWQGWLRSEEADGHIAVEKGTALTVGIADCVPVFIAHQSGVIALLHSGWRGTAAGITAEAISILARNGLPPDELAIHLGPAICGRCYEVSADVREQLTGQPVTRPGHVDLRSLIADHATEIGVQKITVSSYCTRCDNDRFFSHRADDAGRQIAVMAAQG